MGVAWWLGPCALWAVDFSKGRDNNFRIFRGVLWHLLERRNLYLPDPARHADVNHYGPVFAVVIAPFALLPEVVGGLLWNLANAALLWAATGRLRLGDERRRLLLALVVVELLNAAWSNQFNAAVAALVLLTYADVEDGRDFRAPLWALLGVFVKLYSVVGLVFFLFARGKRAFLAGCLAWSALLLAAPMLLAPPGFVLQSYLDWAQVLVEKNAANVVLHTSQDISLMGLVRRLADRPIPSLWFYAAGVPLLLAPLLRLGQHRHLAYRRLVLASLLMFVVLFSSSAEAATYVVCATGAALWLTERPLRGGRAALAATMLLAGLAPTDLLSVPVRHLANDYSLKAIPFALAWLLTCRELLTRDFAPAPAVGAP